VSWPDFYKTDLQPGAVIGAIAESFCQGPESLPTHCLDTRAASDGVL
jgi:hypothetical protein